MSETGGENFPELKIPGRESWFDNLLDERAEDGWKLMGKEGLTRAKLSGSGKFEPIPFQTEGDIKATYLEKAQEQDPDSEFEVDLVLDENTQKLRDIRQSSTPEEYQQHLDNLHDYDKSYLVFVRKKR